ESHLEAASRRGDQSQRLDLTAEGGHQLLRRTDGVGGIVSDDAELDGQGHSLSSLGLLYHGGQVRPQYTALAAGSAEIAGYLVTGEERQRLLPPVFSTHQQIAGRRTLADGRAGQPLP